MNHRRWRWSSGHLACLLKSNRRTLGDHWWKYHCTATLQLNKIGFDKKENMLFFIFFKWAFLFSFSFIFGLSQTNTNTILQQINVKNVHPVYGTGI